MRTVEISGNTDTANTVSAATIQIVRGGDAILRLQRVLAELSARCGQAGAMDDVGYFLTKPGTLKRVPHLLLFSKTPVLNLERLTADELIGAVLLYRYTVLGCGIGTFSTNDRSGRGTLVAPAALRAHMAERVTRSLMDRGVLAVLISFRDEVKDSEKRHSCDGSTANDRTARWAWRERDTPDYLPLEATFDATLAKLGQRTRKNLRYYRKRAEAELGCVFRPVVEIDKREFLEFNRQCMYAVPDKVALWRFDWLKKLEAPLFMGINDKDGRWLSLLGGRRRHDGTEILWQMNRGGLSAYSLSIVMRAYFIQHEISHGMTKLYIEGGTPHPMRFSFVNDNVTDLAVVRRSGMGLFVPMIAKLFIKPDNDLALMLLDKSRRAGSADGGDLLLSPEEEVN